MQTEKWLYGVFIVSLVLLVPIGTAQAIFYLDEDKTIDVSGRIESRLSFRTEDSRGFTFPNVQAGNMVQHRNLAYLELNHDLKKVTGWDLKYHVVGRFFYEGVYDYGPTVFKEVRAGNKDVIDDFKMSAELWECYADGGRGPWHFRVGRQNLAWGETDIFRLLDGINPLDNTFGFVFENLDDRRIPLWMGRGSYNFGNVAGISNLTLEGFWNPGFAGQKFSPLAPPGTPYAAPNPSVPFPTITVKPDTTMQSSRWGARLMGVIAENYNFSLAHYETFLDDPAGLIVIEPHGPVQELTFKKVAITGGSLNFFSPLLRAVIRSEVAWVWGEPAFIPQINTPILYGQNVSGSIPKKDHLRFMLGMDKSFWIKPINKKQEINFSFQYFGEWTSNFDDRQRVPVARFPDGKFVHAHEYEQALTLLVYTAYLHGTINPQLAMAYDPRGAWLFLPSVTYILPKPFDSFRVKLEYDAIYGKFTDFGLFRDRNQVSLTMTFLF